MKGITFITILITSFTLTALLKNLSEMNNDEYQITCSSGFKTPWGPYVYLTSNDDTISWNIKDESYRYKIKPGETCKKSQREQAS